jgi:hypothetical protein
MSDPNPILEANPALLDELFSRDPLGLAAADLDMIAAEFTRMLESWENGKPAKKATKAKVTLADLGL